MAEVLDDHEQGERVKKWLQQNGPSIVVGLAIAAAGLFGYNYWGNYKQQQSLAAAANYALLDEQLTELEQTDVDGAESPDDGSIETAEQAVEQAYQTLQNEHSDNLYAALSALLLADRDVKNDDLDAAIAKYQRVITTANPAFADLARLRLARVQVAAQQADAGLATLSAITAPEHYSALIARTRGDALLAKGDNTAALEAYTEAEEELGGTPDQLLTYRLAQLRDFDVNTLLEDLPETPSLPSFAPTFNNDTSSDSITVTPAAQPAETSDATTELPEISPVNDADSADDLSGEG